MDEERKKADRVRDLKVRVFKKELREGKKGKFLVMRAVHEDDKGEAHFLKILGFGLIGLALDSKLNAGSKCLITGRTKLEEFKRKDGTVGTEVTVFADEAKVVVDNRLVTVDEFTTSPEPF